MTVLRHKRFSPLEGFDDPVSAGAHERELEETHREIGLENCCWSRGRRSALVE